MNKSKLANRSLLIFGLMLFAAVLAQYTRPTIKMAELDPQLNLQQLVLSHFGEWHQQESNVALVIDPSQQQVLEKIYSQTLTRVYKNNSGYFIMLSIAYGMDQRDGLQVHRPEVCYPAQGFRVRDKNVGILQLAPGPGTTIPVTRLHTVLGSRQEPITYWTTVGEYAYITTTEKKIAEMRYGLAGKIPDGLLVRVSSIDDNSERAYAIQAQFASQLFSALPKVYQPRFAGLRSVVP